MGRRPCCSKEGLNRGAWTSLEDQILTKHIKAHGEGNWRNLPKRAGLKRCGKSCRLRWLNYLRPDIKRGNISRDEEDLIVRLHKLLGNRWSLIAGRLPGRTDNEIKNYWNTNLAKKAKAQASSSRNPSSPHDGATTQPQIIHTKATRCTKVVVTAAAEVAHLPENDDVHVHSLSSTEMDPSDPQEKHHHQEPHYGVKMDHITHHEQEGVAQMSSDLGFWNFDHHGRDDTVGADNNLSSMEAYDQVLLMDMPILEDWAANNCLEDHNTATFDLESLAFLLGSGEWPY